MDYQLIKTLSGMAGDARIYQTPLGVVMVSRANTFDRGDETMIFKWGVLEGRVTSWADLYAGYGETHETALNNWLSE